MRELFVYYRVSRGNAGAAALADVAALQRRLTDIYPGLVARLLGRTDPGSGTDTWMETYAMSSQSDGTQIDAAFEAELAGMASMLSHVIDGTRHVERFETLDLP